MWELDYKESWALKNWCFWTVVLEKSLESPLTCKEIKPVNSKGNQCWIFIERTDAEAEVPILWPSDAKNWLIGKDPGAGKDWRREGKGTTEDEMVGWHHWLNGHESEQAPEVGEVQGSLVCCSPLGHKESDTTEWLNWTDVFRNRFYDLNPCISSYLEKHYILHGDIRFSWLTETFWKMSASWHWTPPSPKPYIYWLSPTAALEQTLRAIGDAASQAAVLILPQIKLNSQLSSCTSFFSQHYLLFFNISMCIY